MKASKGFLEEMESVLDNAEEALRRISGQCRLQNTCHSDVFCSRIPAHWRSNKSLPTPFIILALCPIPDGTRVCVSAGNDENFCADVKNNTAEFIGQMARFSDLRFVGKSGRGKNFNLSITIFTIPLTQVVIVPNIVKVTVDGPRETRTTSKFLSGQNLTFPKKLRFYDGRTKIAQQHTDFTSQNRIYLDDKIISQPILKESERNNSSILTQQQQNFPFLSAPYRFKLNRSTAATLINPNLQYFENKVSPNTANNNFQIVSSNFGMENNSKLNFNFNPNSLNMFPQPIYGTSSHQIITLNEAIKNAQQRINSQVNNFSKLLIPSYCSSFFPSPSQFIPLQSHIGNHFLNKDLLPLIPPISSWTTLLKNNINNLNNDEALLQQGENLKENPHYLIQTTSISNKSNDNCLKVGGVSEDSKFSSIPKRRYSGTFKHDANGWKKDETNNEAVKRCKLTLKDEVDNKITTSGSNKDNKSNSSQPLLRPQVQQGLWRPFPL